MVLMMVAAMGAGLSPGAVTGQAAQDPFPFRCDLTEHDPAAPVRARLEPGGVALEWAGAPGREVTLAVGVRDGEPVVRRIALRSGSGEWQSVVEDAGIEYRIVEGLRRITTQQLRPLRDLGVEITQEVVDRHKWDAFWDAPLDLSTEVRGGNPPPPEGVADQPGLPRSPDEIRRGTADWRVEGCRVVSDGRRASIHLPGVELGSFSGELVLTGYQGTNLIRVEVVAATERPSVAYKYDMGLTSLALDRAPRGATSVVRWRDLSGAPQAYFLDGPPNGDPVPLRAANRLAVAETGNGAFAVFPPPHTFFWAREVEVNVGYNWYRKDGPSSFSVGIRQGEEEVVERYRANWSLYSAPPGTAQRMAGYLYPTLDGADEAFAGALAFTNGDVYRPLPGYRVMGSHYHTNVGRELMASGSVDTRLPDFEALRAAGIDIAGPVDRPRDETRLQELRWLFRGALQHSDSSFVLLPEMENSSILGGHWDLLFSHPVYWVDERPAGTPRVTDHPEHGRTYNVGSVDDVLAMLEAEDMIVYMPHPRTKGSTGYPDAIRDSPQFLHDRYRGVGWRWGMGADLSERRLSEKRVLPLLDDMNNWIADTDLRPKYLLAITETYSKAPGDDVYGNGPVSYVRMDALPRGEDYSAVVDALMEGEYFVTSGEVLIPSHEYHVSEETGRREGVLTARVEWTFPLEFVEVVYGDGETTNRTVIPATDLPPFGSHTFEIPFDATGQAWVRFAAWDSAGNGALTMPVRIGE